MCCQVFYLLICFWQVTERFQIIEFKLIKHVFNLKASHFLFIFPFLKN